MSVSAYIHTCIVLACGSDQSISRFLHKHMRSVQLQLNVSQARVSVRRCLHVVYRNLHLCVQIEFVVTVQTSSNVILSATILKFFSPD